MLDQIKTDIDAVMHRDPAAKTRLEAALCYPGLHAIWLHRLAHKLYLKGWVLIPRLLNTFSRFLTGIDIHPGATLGPGLFIDHGMGLVIGETAELGSNVTLYQGVTLGGTGKEKGKRHPTIGDNVVVSSGAKVLGLLYSRLQFQDRRRFGSIKGSTAKLGSSRCSRPYRYQRWSPHCRQRYEQP